MIIGVEGKWETKYINKYLSDLTLLEQALHENKVIKKPSKFMGGSSTPARFGLVFKN